LTLLRQADSDAQTLASVPEGRTVVKNTRSRGCLERPAIYRVNEGERGLSPRFGRDSFQTRSNS
jgi:hypothetical protein